MKMDKVDYEIECFARDSESIKKDQVKFLG